MALAVQCFMTSVLLAVVTISARVSGTGQLDIAVLHSSGMEYSDDVLWTATCSSVFCCARKCISDNQCVSFTTSETGSECRGYSKNPIKEGSTSSSSPEAKLYLMMSRTEVSTRNGVINKTNAVTTTINGVSMTQTADITSQASGIAMPKPSSMGTPQNYPGFLNGPGGTQNPGTQNQSGQNPVHPGFWRELSCSSFEQCSMLPNVECYDGKCLCSPGYYYSFSSNTCEINCASLMSCNEGAGPPTCMEEYKDAKWDSDSSVLHHTDAYTSASDCAYHCTRYSTCRASVFYSDTHVCYIFSTAKLDQPQTWQQPLANVYYFQRLCQ